MDLLIAFAIFLIVMVSAIIFDFSMIIALLVGLFAFMAVGKHRGYSIGSMTKMGIEGGKDSLIVIEVMCVIGFVTAVWRVSGTITVFVYYGMKIITPNLFLIITFVLSCLLSYALGTSFGVAGTVGVIFMTLARSGGVNPVITAGVIMSGVYFGDRGSPVSSSANMVASVTKTKIYDNVKQMMRVAIVPLVITTIIYAVLSFMNPISHVDEELVASFESEFILSPWAFVPAVFMLILPLLKVDVITSMLASIVSGILVSVFVQGVPILEVLKICIFGYEAEAGSLGEILNGGGLVSMLEIVVILIISSCYSGIFSGTGMIDGLQERLNDMTSRFGRYAVMFVMSLASAMVFCNQTIATLICADLLEKSYLEGGGSHEEMAIDMENTVILISCLVPWCIGCSVPLSFLGVGVGCLPFAVYMYAVPLMYFFMKKRWYPNKEI